MKPAPAKTALDGGPSKLSPFALNSPKMFGFEGRRRTRPTCRADRRPSRAVRTCGARRLCPWRSSVARSTDRGAPRRPCSTSPCSCRSRSRSRRGGPAGNRRSPGRRRSTRRSRRAVAAVGCDATRSKRSRRPRSPCRQDGWAACAVPSSHTVIPTKNAVHTLMARERSAKPGDAESGETATKGWRASPRGYSA